MARYHCRALGESALTIDAGPDAMGLADYLRGLKIKGVVDVFAAFDKVAVYATGDTFAALSAAEQATEEFSGSGRSNSQLHRIPVCYDLGADSAELCELVDMTTSQLIEAHSRPEYLCEAVGFCPGFPYLTGLDPRLASVPRRSTPRTQVDPGTVALAAGMTGVYTLRRPGGWWLIGRTPLVLVDVEAEYFPVSVGDRVRFDPIGRAEFDRLEGQRL
ncbi:MAG: carboxyltransferase domain-containing protein [Armatimonadetes bacterium]|nr:carboxyltransferase domain-containing protein [Armatimonadota bacterium]